MAPREIEEMKAHPREIEATRAYLISIGRVPGECTRCFVRGVGGGTLVVHFAEEEPARKGDGKYWFVDSDSAIVAMYDFADGSIHGV